MSRRHNPSRALVLFGDRTPARALRAVGPPEPLAMAREQLVDLLLEMGAAIAPDL